ncbi:MAG: hypothetical protein JOZ08_02745, partial [Verrucomicrobia bacterium]|nr:hypothetical protein [Verrucomicrobiota bacterium]
GIGIPSSNPDTVTGSRSYSWDGANRLIQVAYSATGNSTSLSYDGFGRLTRVVETANGTVQSDQRYVWIGNVMAQQRSSTGAVAKAYFEQGFLAGSTAYYYGKDHLGSIRNLIDSSGALQTHLDYGANGELTELSGATQPDFAYTGLFYHQRSGLYFAEYRAYDSGLKRWLNRDPILEKGGINLYAYVLGNPIRYSDPSGQCPLFLIPAIIWSVNGIIVATGLAINIGSYFNQPNANSTVNSGTGTSQGSTPTIPANPPPSPNLPGTNTSSLAPIPAEGQ